MSADKLASMLNHALAILHTAGATDADLERIESILKNSGPELAAAIDYLYAIRVN
jgi:hypothetical protein